MENKTLGVIKDFLPEGVISEETKAAIINSVYFKASWFYPFEKKINFIGSFFVSENETTTVEYMVAEENFGTKYDEQLGCEILTLPYVDEDYHMLILKPDNKSSFNNLVSNFDDLDLVNIHEDLERVHSKLVRLELPKFNVSYRASLLDTFQNLGVSDLNNLSKISDDDLYVCEFMHAAKIVVNEEGSEVAAVSGAVLDLRSVVKPKVVRLNSPFLFVVLDTTRSIPLVVGKIQSPSVSETLSLRSTEVPPKEALQAAQVPPQEALQAAQVPSQEDLQAAALPPNRNSQSSGICPSACLNGGLCADGKCVCQQDFEGEFCQHKVTICAENLAHDAVAFPCRKENK